MLLSTTADVVSCLHIHKQQRSIHQIAAFGGEAKNATKNKDGPSISILEASKRYAFCLAKKCQLRDLHVLAPAPLNDWSTMTMQTMNFEIDTDGVFILLIKLRGNGSSKGRFQPIHFELISQVFFHGRNVFLHPMFLKPGFELLYVCFRVQSSGPSIGSQSSILRPSGSMIQANLPYSYSSGSPAISTPSFFSSAKSASRS